MFSKLQKWWSLVSQSHFSMQFNEPQSHKPAFREDSWPIPAVTTGGKGGPDMPWASPLAQGRQLIYQKSLKIKRTFEHGYNLIPLSLQGGDSSLQMIGGITILISLSKSCTHHFSYLEYRWNCSVSCISVRLFVDLVFISIYSITILSFKSSSILRFILHDPLLPSLAWCPFFSQIITLLLTSLFLKSRFWVWEETHSVLARCNLFHLARWALVAPISLQMT